MFWVVKKVLNNICGFHFLTFDIDIGEFQIF